MGPLHQCPYRAHNYGVVGAASPFPTQTIVQPDFSRVGTTQASLLAIILPLHHSMLNLVLALELVNMHHDVTHLYS